MAAEGPSHAGFHVGLAPGDRRTGPARAWIGTPVATLENGSLGTKDTCDDSGTEATAGWTGSLAPRVVGWAADRARSDARAVEDWERCRAGRLVPLWTVYVDAWAAALDDTEAADRLLYSQRTLYHCAPGVPVDSWDLKLAYPEPLADKFGIQVLEVPAGELDAAHRIQLIADYPPAGWALRHQPHRLHGPREHAHLADYHTALTHAVDRLLAGQHRDKFQREREVLPPDTPLRFYRAQRHTQVLAGPEVLAARERGEQLAATMVDYLGRPVGRLAEVELDDGYVSADRHWVHPAEGMDYETVHGLWADYEAYQGTTDHAQAQARALTRGAARLHDLLTGAGHDGAEFEAKLNTQPGGQRTLSSLAEFALVEQATIAEDSGRHWTPMQLREEADRADYLARRVYGKVVETDDAVKRIECLHHRAAVLRDHAERRTSHN